MGRIRDEAGGAFTTNVDLIRMIVRLREAVNAARRAMAAGEQTDILSAGDRLYQVVAAIRRGRLPLDGNAAGDSTPSRAGWPWASSLVTALIPKTWQRHHQRRQLIVRSKEIAHRSRHVRHMRGDLIDGPTLEAMREGERRLREALKSDDAATITEIGEYLLNLIHRVVPNRFLKPFQRRLEADAARCIAACADAEKGLKRARGQESALARALSESLRPVTPYEAPLVFTWLADNIEVISVAIAVALAFRTYFLQPFKIPTGSMQPSLYGITSQSVAEAHWTDRMPVKIAKWIITGEWYDEVTIGPTLWDRFPLSIVKATLTRRPYRDPGTSAVLRGPFRGGDHDPSALYYFVGENRYRVPKDAVIAGEIRLHPGQVVQNGDCLWRGRWKAGDHLFVNRVRWNFTRPLRGSVMVFNTTDIPGLPQKTHYIKRMVGMPGETIAIHPPTVMINGQPLLEPNTIGRLARREPPYEYGYTLAEHGTEGLLRRPTDTFTLTHGQYFALGDNTPNSRDSRYWGAVPEDNLVGPAVMVYWPFSKRWGFMR